MKLPEFIRKGLLRRALTILASRTPDVTLDHGGKVFLLRWHLIPRNRIMNIYLHRFIDSDPGRALHDHPWASLSLMLRGGLIELSEPEWPSRPAAAVRDVTEGDIRFRRASFAHRLNVPMYSDPLSAISIFITGPKVREWGFHTDDGWVHWQEYCERDGVK